MKKINHYISAIIVAAMTAGFASCSSSDEPSSVSDNTPKELTITIKTQGVTTKAAETSDPGSQTPNPENTMNRITIGIFDNAGTTVRAIQEFAATSDLSNVGAGKYFFNQQNNTATVTVVTTKMDTNDQILVAVNAPTGKFAGVTSATTFKQKSIDAETALYKDTNGSNPSDGKAVNNNVPMFGEAVSRTGSTTNYSANVSVKHLTAKVTLEELKVDFAVDGPYSAATFTPTEIFMYNVPNGLLFDYSNPYLTSSFLNGEGKTTYPDPIYLTTGDISSGATPLKGTATGGSNSFATKYYFYITPNDQDDANKTKLVIKGKFDPDGDGTPLPNDVYYPVKLNYNVNANGTTSVPSGSTAYVVSPNKNYKCKVTIKTIGSTGPGDDIDPTTAEISITVTNFEEVNQETVFQ